MTAPKDHFTLLIVEDDDSIRLSLKHFFENENFLVFTAENGIEALAKLKILTVAEHPDLILTDITMPYDGQMLIQTLEESELLKDIPIVPMSANNLSHISGKKVLPKPFELQEVLDAVLGTIKKDRKDRHLDDPRA